MDWEANLSEDDRAALTREAFKWSNENIPDPSQPLHCQVVESLIVGYQVSAGTEISLEDVKRAAVLPPLVPTATVLRNMDLFLDLASSGTAFPCQWSGGCWQELADPSRHSPPAERVGCCFECRSLKLQCTNIVQRCTAEVASVLRDLHRHHGSDLQATGRQAPGIVSEGY